MNKRNVVRLLWCGIGLGICGAWAGCDDGDIHEKYEMEQSGVEVIVDGTFRNVERWPSGYSVVLAGFETTNYAVQSKGLKSGNEQQTVKTNMPTSVSTVEICAINRIREKVATFYSQEVELTEGHLVEIHLGELEVGPWTGIQSALFNTTCSRCHGGSNSAAAGLYLTEGKSYEALVGQPSTRDEEGRNLIEPADKENSFVYQVITGRLDTEFGVKHQSFTGVIPSGIRDLLGSWIDSGAVEDGKE